MILNAIVSALLLIFIIYASIVDVFEDYHEYFLCKIFLKFKKYKKVPTQMFEVSFSFLTCLILFIAGIKIML